MIKTMFIVLLLGFAILTAPAARAEGLCAAHPDDDTLRPLPAMLEPEVQKEFGLHDISAAQTQKLT